MYGQDKTKRRYFRSIQARKQLSWLKACTGRSHSSSEESSEDTLSAETHVETSPRNGSTRFRTREKTDRPGVDTYTVLIELKDEGARPSVRLSNCESPVLEDAPSRRESRMRSKSDINPEPAAELAQRQSQKVVGL
uniref:Uncharacterized protein n=1 Tax=Heterorhabditis bacteriophora TaxID=37862 RepID=A0A1I7XF97_HETBA